MHLESLAFASLVVASALLTARLVGGRGSARRVGRSFRPNAPWLLLLAATTLAQWAFNRLPRGRSPLPFDQSTALADGLLQALQAAVPHELLPLFAAAYLGLFPALLIALPLSLMATERWTHLRAYCLALSIAYLALVAAHLLVLSPRPGLTPGSGVAGLLYSDPFWGGLSLDIGSRGNSFPSGHTTAVTAMLVSLIDLRRARLVLLVALAAVVTGVLYLGLHWPLDVLAGAALGAAAGLAARHFAHVGSARGPNVSE